MKFCPFIALFLVTFLYEEVCTENEININNEVKKGAFPYMAYLFYSDASVKENGQRFMRGAVLLTRQWLMSSAIDPIMIKDEVKGFPKQALYARVGSTVIDSDFDLDEENGEQEREVVHLVRPASHNFVSWWISDISLLKTLSPFNVSEPALPTLNFRRKILDRKCLILVFTKKYNNATEDRSLMKLAVEFLPPSAKNCGPLFNETTMACGVDVDDSDLTSDPTFCKSNRGSPLICETEITGIQSYVESESQCKQPYLYQLVSSWNEFINCAVYNDFQDPICRSISLEVKKDNLPLHYEGLSTDSDLEVAAAQNLPVVAAAKTSKSTQKSIQNIPQESETEKVVTGNQETQTINYELRLEESNTPIPQSLSQSKSNHSLPPLGGPPVSPALESLHIEHHGTHENKEGQKSKKSQSSAPSKWNQCIIHFLLSTLVLTCLI